VAKLISAGPLELTRRTSALVYDDTLEITEDIAINAINGPLSASIASLPPPSALPHGHIRARSSASDFPPPITRRMSTDGAGIVRPVPFSAKFKRVHPGTTGVTVLEHMERLDKVEAGLERLAVGADAVDALVPEQDEEQDVGELVRHPIMPLAGLFIPPDALAGPSSAPSVPVGLTPELATVHELASSGELSSVDHEAAEEEEEEDVAVLSKSLSHLDGTLSGRLGQLPSRPMRIDERNGLDWMQEESAKKKTVIVEVRIYVWSAFHSIGVMLTFVCRDWSLWRRSHFCRVGDLGILLAALDNISRTYSVTFTAIYSTL
jgi:phosphatidylinositol 4-kinase type 2